MHIQRRRQPSRPMCHGIALVLGAALVTCTPHLLSAGVLEGDPELLKMVAMAHKSNKESILTWSGEATIVQSAEDSQGLLSTFKATAVFVSDQAQQATRWRWTYEDRKLRSDQSGSFEPQELEVVNAMYKGDSFYNYTYTPEDRDRKRQLIIQAAESTRIGAMLESFEPTWYLTKDGEDLCNTLLFHYERAHNSALSDRSVKREGDLVVFEQLGNTAHTRYVFDLSRGGNLVLFSNSWGQNGVATWEWEYEKQGATWIPVGLHYHTAGGDGPGLAVDRRVRFVRNVVNQPVNPQEFLVEKLGVVPGDMVVDHRAGVTYTHEDGTAEAFDKVLAAARIPVQSSRTGTGASSEPSPLGAAGPATQRSSASAPAGFAHGEGTRSYWLIVIVLAVVGVACLAAIWRYASSGGARR